MTAALRHQCRYCRTKLSEPSDNLRRAFCCKGCHSSFYRSRCVVCEEPIRRKTERQKTCIDVRCKAEARRFPLAYSWPETTKTANHPSDDITPPGKPHFTGIKTAIKGGVTPWWEADLDIEHQYLLGDHLLARISLRQGRWLMTWPRTQAWLGKSLDTAKGVVEEMFRRSIR